MKTDKEIFRELWTWLTDNPGEPKQAWPEFEDESVRLRYEEHNWCPACRHGKMLCTGISDSACNHCPINESAEEPARAAGVYVEYSCLKGLYHLWLFATDAKEESKFAAIIRDLEWRG